MVPAATRRGFAGFRTIIEVLMSPVEDENVRITPNIHTSYRQTNEYVGGITEIVLSKILKIFNIQNRPFLTNFSMFKHRPLCSFWDRMNIHEGFDFTFFEYGLLMVIT